MSNLRGYFLFCLNRALRTDKICPIAISANDYKTLPESVQEEGEALARETVVWLTRIMQEGRDQGVFTFPGSAEDKAVLIQGRVARGRATGPAAKS